MAREIERKYLVMNDAWRAAVVRQRRFEQGYMAITDDCAVRVRIDGYAARLNIKDATLDIERREYEYEIPLADAREMLEVLCAGRTLAKMRYWVRHGEDTWEVDVFEGANAGLVLAEIELADRAQTFAAPEWLGREVSGEARYLNASLAVTPFRTWGDDCMEAGGRATQDAKADGSAAP